MITVIMLDIGGVVLDTEKSFRAIYEDFGKKIGLPPGKSEEFHERYIARMLSGKMSARQFFRVLRKKFLLREKERELMDLWVGVAVRRSKVNKQLLRVLARLQKTANIVALSNITEMRMAVDERLGIYHYFDRLFLSCQLGMRKPHKRIYRYALKHLKVRPEQVLFIDDKEANVAAARELGMNTIRFTGDATLFGELRRLDLL
jgi:putative hydrolase of the HAD superfamily